MRGTFAQMITHSFHPLALARGRRSPRRGSMDRGDIGSGDRFDERRACHVEGLVNMQSEDKPMINNNAFHKDGRRPRF